MSSAKFVSNFSAKPPITFSFGFIILSLNLHGPKFH